MKLSLAAAIALLAFSAYAGNRGDGIGGFSGQVSVSDQEPPPPSPTSFRMVLPPDYQGPTDRGLALENGRVVSDCRATRTLCCTWYEQSIQAIRPYPQVQRFQPVNRAAVAKNVATGGFRVEFSYAFADSTLG